MRARCLRSVTPTVLFIERHLSISRSEILETFVLIQITTCTQRSVGERRDARLFRSLLITGISGGRCYDVSQEQDS